MKKQSLKLKKITKKNIFFKKRLMHQQITKLIHVTLRIYEGV
jgi:hypothetical protein